jgi:hypothetical protein
LVGGFTALFKAIILFIVIVGKWNSEKNGSIRTTVLFWRKKTAQGPNLFFVTGGDMEY